MRISDICVRWMRAFFASVLCVVVAFSGVPLEGIALAIGETANSAMNVSDEDVDTDKPMPSGDVDGKALSDVLGLGTSGVAGSSPATTDESLAPVAEESWHVIVRFDANGGTGEMADADVVLDDSVWELPAGMFSRDGYRFVGWATTSDGKDVPDVPETDVNEGMAGIRVSECQEVVNLRFSESLEDGSTVEHDLGACVRDGSLTVYAQWEKVGASKEEVETEAEEEAIKSDDATKQGAAKQDGLQADAKGDDAAKQDDVSDDADKKDETSKDAENQDATKDETSEKARKQDVKDDAVKDDAGKSENDARQDVVKDEDSKEVKDDVTEDETSDDAKAGAPKDAAKETKAEAKDAKAEAKDEKDGENVSDAGKRYAHRLIVGTGPTTTITVGTVLGRLDDAVLLGFEDEASLEKAEALYKLNAEYVARDMPLGASAGEDVKDVEMGVADNPFTAAGDATGPTVMAVDMFLDAVDLLAKRLVMFTRRI